MFFRFCYKKKIRHKLVSKQLEYPVNSFVEGHCIANLKNKKMDNSFSLEKVAENIYAVVEDDVVGEKVFALKVDAVMYKGKVMIPTTVYVVDSESIRVLGFKRISFTISYYTFGEKSFEFKNGFLNVLLEELMILLIESHITFNINMNHFDFNKFKSSQRK